MQHFDLSYSSGHLFIRIDTANWIIDTGSPKSFGVESRLIICEQEFFPETEYMDLNAYVLSAFMKTRCSGLLGADVLNEFDWVIDVANQSAIADAGNIGMDGDPLPIQLLMGVPLITAKVNNDRHEMFFDTGAQVSYLQSPCIGSFPNVGVLTDFYPNFGEFQTTTYQVPIILGQSGFILRCGSLPALLEMTLLTAGATGIVGNEVFLDRRVGYFPRRKQVVLGFS